MIARTPRPPLLAACLCAMMTLAATATFVCAQPKPDSRYAAGLGLLERGMNDLAAAELRAFLAGAPDAPEAPNARYALAVSLIRLGDHEAAAAELERVLDIDGFEFAADATLLRAQCDVDAGEHARAAARLERLAKAHPAFDRLDQATALRGEALYLSGRHRDAKDQLDDFGDRWPRSESRDRADLYCAFAESALGESRAAADRASALRRRSTDQSYQASAALLEAQCRHRMGNADQALALYEAAAGGDPAVRPASLLGMAQLHRSRGEFKLAQLAIDDLFKLKPSASTLAAARLEQAQLMLEQDQTGQAIAMLDRLGADRPDELADDVAYSRARCDLVQRKFDAAATRLTQAASSYPKSELVPEMLFDRAAALAGAAKEQDAAEAYAAFAERFPKHGLVADAMLARASCLHRLNQHDECIVACRQYLDARPTAPGTPSARLLIAESFYLLHRYDEAAAAYGDFIEKHGADPHVSRAAIRRGLCLARLGRPDEAQRVLEDALASHQGIEPVLAQVARSELGEICFARSDWPGAEAWFSRVAKSAANGLGNPDVLLRLGLSVQRQGRGAEAIAIYDILLRDDAGSSQSAQAEFERGQALLFMDRIDDAKAAFERVAARTDDPAHRFKIHAMRQLASIAARQGRSEEAASLLAQVADGSEAGASRIRLDQAAALLASGQYRQAESVLTTLIDSEPDKADLLEARARRAIAVARQGRHSEAIAEFEAVAPSIDDLAPDLATSIHVEYAASLLGAERDEEAAAAFLALCTSTTPDYYRAHAALELGRIQADQDECAEALTSLDITRAAIAQLKPDEAAQLAETEQYLRARCLLKLDRPAEAAKLLDEFQRRYSRSAILASARLLHGEALLRTGRGAEAAVVLRAVMDSHPAPEIAESALLRLGEACTASQQWSRADETYTQFLRDFSSSDFWFHARFGQGWARESQGRHDAAIEAYADVVARHQGPTAARAQFQIGECLFAMKKYDDAVRELLKVDLLYSYPEWSAAALYEAGRCLTEMNRTADAARQFNDVITRFDDSKWASLAKDRLAASRAAPVPGRSR